MTEQKYSRREFLAVGTGALVAVVGSHIAGRLEGEFVDESEHAEAIAQLKNPRDRIQYAKELFDTNPSFRAGKGTWRELANTSVAAAPDMVRHEYATDFFLNTEGVDLQGSERIPKSVRENLSRIVPGLIAQESKYDNSAVSSANARTMWQIIPGFYNDKLESGENLMDMTVSTRIAFQKFEDIYKKFQTGIKWRSIDVPGLNFDSFQRHFNLTDQQWENFLTMAIVNAYNAGERRMLEILNWFLETYVANDISAANDSTELDLFAMMTDSARASGNFSRYGPHANNYVFYCIGGSESLTGELPIEFSNIDFNNPTAGGLSGWAQRRVADTVLPVAAGTAAGVLTKQKLDERAEKFSDEDVQNPRQYLNSVTAGISDLIKRASKSMSSINLRKKTHSPELMEAPDKAEKNKPLISRRRLLALGVAAPVVGSCIFFRKQIGAVIDEGLEVLNGREKFSVEEAREEVARLRARGIRLFSSTQKFFEDGLTDAEGRTAFVGMRKDVWETMEQLLEDLDLLDKGDKSIIITGLAESAGHSNRVHGHGGGYSMDLRLESARKVTDALLENTRTLDPTTEELPTSRELLRGHLLLNADILIGQKIFRYNSKYFLFGLKHEGKIFICYFDGESTHKHMEMIPWEDYNQESISEFVEISGIPTNNPDMRGVWRQEVRDYVRSKI